MESKKDYLCNMGVYRDMSPEEFRDIENRILYEDNHLLVFNKRTGEIVQGDKTGDEPLSETLKAFIARRDGKPGQVFMGVPHRLDRPVSGVTLFAKTSKCLARMNELIRQRNIEKQYWAIVEGRPPADTDHLIHYLYRNSGNNRSYVSETEKKDWQRAELTYKLLAASERYSLIEVTLLTGRHHQIRAQLSAIGCPIKGDLKYGARRSNEDGSILLHARRIAFEHPVAHVPVEVLAEPFNPLFRKILEG